MHNLLYLIYHYPGTMKSLQHYYTRCVTNVIHI